MRLVEIRRVSTEEQAKDDRSGLERQAESNRRTAARVGAELIAPPIIITDVCRENFVDTPEWQQIRGLIASPDVHIVVDTQDRMIGALEGLPILIECKRTKTRIYHSDGFIDPTTLEGQLVATWGAVRGGHELNLIRHRVQGGKEAKRRAGLFPSGAQSLPTGIDFVRTKGQRGRWTYNDKIAVVREVFRLVVVEGLRNWAEVGRRATTNSGVPPFGNCGMVKVILTNPIYNGWWIVNKKCLAGPTRIKPDGRRKSRTLVARTPEETHRHRVFRPKGETPAGDDRDEAVVDDATWDAVQDIVAAKAGAFRPREPKGDEYVYANFVRCSECGGALWCKTHRGHVRYAYYACPKTGKSGGRCALQMICSRVVNVAIDRLFATTFADPTFRTTLIAGGLSGQVEDLSKRVAERSSQVTKLRAARKKLLDIYLRPDSTWDREDLDRRASMLDAEIGRLERDLTRLREAQADNARATALDSLCGVLSTLEDFHAWSRQEKRELLARFFPHIAISRQGIEHVVVTLPRVDGNGQIGPVGSLGVPSPPLTLAVNMTWEQLQPRAVMTNFGLPQRDTYTAREVRERLGWSAAKFKELRNKGLLPRPTGKRRGKPAWTEADVRRTLEHSKDKNCIRAKRPWTEAELHNVHTRINALPKKSTYTRRDAAMAFGVRQHHFVALIKSGHVTNCERHNLRPQQWTMDELHRAMHELRGYPLVKDYETPSRTTRPRHWKYVLTPEEAQDALDRAQALPKRGWFSSAQAASVLGVSPRTLRVAVRRGRVHCENQSGHHHYWSAEELGRAVRKFADSSMMGSQHYKGAQTPRWKHVLTPKEAQDARGRAQALPKSDSYTAAHVARVLGVSVRTLRMAIGHGRVSNCARRYGHLQLWTRDELERAIEEFADSSVVVEDCKLIEGRLRARWKHVLTSDEVQSALARAATLPTSDSYTAVQVAWVLGENPRTFRMALRYGRITNCQRCRGHLQLWSAAEIVRAVREFATVSFLNSAIEPLAVGSAVADVSLS